MAPNETEVTPTPKVDNCDVKLREEPGQLSENTGEDRMTSAEQRPGKEESCTGEGQTIVGRMLSMMVIEKLQVSKLELVSVRE